MDKRASGVSENNPTRKAGGHGDHWGCLYKEVDKGELIGLISKTIEEDRTPDNSVQSVSVYHSPGEGLRMCVLVANERVESAYPQLSGGPIWPITITQVVPWANGLEGQVTGVCMGAAVSFFDTRFYANAIRYTIGETYSFRMGALAYKVGLAEEMEAESGEGDSVAKVSLRGASAFMPATLSNESADIDDFWFYSPLEAVPGQVEFTGRILRVYPVTLALPNDFEMRVSLYTALHTVSPDMEGVAPGDDLTGFLWLQGYLAEE